MSDGVWQSVSEVAAARGVSKQAISKRLKALGGRVSTRQDGPRLLVNIAEYDRIVGAETDPAQALRNRNVTHGTQGTVGGGAAAGGGTGEVPVRPQGDLSQRVFSQQRAKRESYEAELARLDLEERMGRLLKVQDVTEAMVKLATAMLRVIDAMPAETEDPAVRTILKRKAAELREVIAAEMRVLAKPEAAEVQS